MFRLLGNTLTKIKLRNATGKIFKPRFYGETFSTYIRGNGQDSRYRSAVREFVLFCHEFLKRWTDTDWNELYDVSLIIKSFFEKNTIIWQKELTVTGFFVRYD